MFERFQKKQEKNFLLNFSLIILLVFWLFYILYIWQALIIPFFISILFSLAILWLSNFYKKLKIPASLSMILSIFSYFLFFYFIYLIIYSNINELIILAPTYQVQVSNLIRWITDYFWFDNFRNYTNEALQYINFQNVINYILSALTSISSSIWTILFYTIFILLESIYFEKKLELMIWDIWKREEIKQVLKKIEEDVKWYFFIKTFVSFLTAFISYIIMYSFWLNFAAFWALLIFILNFVPNIGSIIAVLFPILLSFVQNGFWFYSSITLTILLITIQMIIWNIVEPKMMWNRLNLSPLIIIISLSFWWYLWGIIGMLLSVPLVVIMNIILSKFEQTKPVAIFLSEKWDLDFFEKDWKISEKRRMVLEKIKWKLKK